MEDQKRQEQQQRFSSYQQIVQQFATPLIQGEFQRRSQDYNTAVNNMWQMISQKSQAIDQLVAQNVQQGAQRIDAILQAMFQIQQAIIQGVFGSGRA